MAMKCFNALDETIFARRKTMFQISRQLIRAIQFTVLTATLVVAQAASAAKDKTVFVEFAGLDPTEVLTIKIDGAKEQQTASGGSDSFSQCDSSEVTVLIDKELDSVSPRLAEAVATGKLFDQVIVYRGNKQTFLENVLITSYSVSGSAGNLSPPLESISLQATGINSGRR
jgi:hypothetical protein